MKVGLKVIGMLKNYGSFRKSLFQGLQSLIEQFGFPFEAALHRVLKKLDAFLTPLQFQQFRPPYLRLMM